MLNIRAGNEAGVHITPVGLTSFAVSAHSFIVRPATWRFRTFAKLSTVSGLNGNKEMGLILLKPLL